MTPKKYKNAAGETRWKFQISMGNDSSGKRINWTRQGFESKTDALIEYSKLLEERENLFDKEKYIDNNTMTISELYSLWHDEYAPSVERSTLSKVESYFKNHIIPDTGKMKLSKLKPSVIQPQVNQWALEAKSGVVWARYLKAIIQFALLKEYISRDPFAGVKIPPQKKISSYDKENFLTTEQLKIFLEYWSTKGINRYAYFRLLAYSGMRRGEIIALEWSDIDFDKRTLRINKAIGQDYRNGHAVKYEKGTKNDPSNRTISIDQNTLDILKLYKETTAEEVMWPGKHKYMDFNVPMRWMTSMRNNPSVPTELKRVTLHGLRHTHSTLLFEQAALQGKQAPLNAVSKRIGHSDLTTTLNIYTHVSERANDLIDDILSES